MLVRLPIADRLEYLGAILSYGPMESQTVAFRASRAWANYTKLRPMLRTTSSFSIRQKLRLFQACVVPAMLYGIIGIGVTASSLRVIQSTLARMLRKILRVHEHGVSNQAVLCRASVHPAENLQSLIGGKECTLQLEGHQSNELRAPALHRLQDISRELQRVDHLPQAGLIEIDRTGEEVLCPLCGLEFHNQKTLRQNTRPSTSRPGPLLTEEGTHSLDSRSVGSVG